jgi:HAD superfamily hydrolase (TIGR01484 family)
MKPPFDLLSTDFDGTIFAEFEDPPVAPKLVDLIERLQAQGVKWVINTGREMGSLMESLGRASLRVRPDFLILVEREIYVHSNARYVALDPWNARCTADHAALFEQIAGELPEMRRWVEKNFPDTTIYEDIYSPFCLIANSNEESDEIQEALEARCETIVDLVFVRNDVYSRVCHAAYSKGTALAHLAAKLGLDSARTLAAGDHLNDLPMLSSDVAGWLVAPVNAVPTVKRRIIEEGGHVSELGHGYGVAAAIERLWDTGELPETKLNLHRI